MSYPKSMKNRLIIIIAISLFLLIPYSTYAEEGDSGSEESKPDYIVEPVWDDDVPWSDYIGKPVENSPQFKIKNIGGPLTASDEAACRENCNYWVIINEGKDDGYNLTYSLATWSNSSKDTLFDTGEYIGYFPRIFGVTDVKVCFDYENPDSVVDESNETNNCWEGTINFFPDLRWFEGNPNGSFDVMNETKIDYGYNETLGHTDTRHDPIEAQNDVWITDNGWVRIYVNYACSINGSAGPCSYDGNFIQISVTIDGEEVNTNHPHWLGASEADARIENTSVVRVCFDPENIIEETNEDNNCIEKTLVNASYVPDSDGDGVKDDRDLCLGTLEGEVVSPIFGCPDSDGDGYWDNQDICAGGDDGVDEDNDDIPDACDGFIDVGEATTEEDSGRLPGPSFIVTIGVFAFAAITSRNQRLI
jgi:hypothetical protein